MNKKILLASIVVGVTFFTGCATSQYVNKNNFATNKAYSCKDLYQKLYYYKDKKTLYLTNYQKKNIVKIKDAFVVKNCLDYSNYEKQKTTSWNQKIEQERALFKKKEEKKKKFWEKRLVEIKEERLQKEAIERAQIEKLTLDALKKESKKNKKVKSLIVENTAEEVKDVALTKDQIVNMNYRIVTNDYEIRKNMKNKKIITKYYSKVYKGQDGVKLPLTNYLVQKACKEKVVKDALTINGFQARFKFYNKYGTWLATHNLNLSCKY